MAIPLTATERSTALLVPSVNGWERSVVTTQITQDNNASILALQQSITDIETAFDQRPFFRSVFLYDTLTNLNAANHHEIHTYAFVIENDLELKSNGTDAWAAVTGSLISLAGNNNVYIKGNVSYSAGTAYLSGLGGKNMVYEELGDTLAG